MRIKILKMADCPPVRPSFIHICTATARRVFNSSQYTVYTYLLGRVLSLPKQIFNSVSDCKDVNISSGRLSCSEIPDIFSI